MAKTGGKPAAGKENGKKPNMDENAIKTDVAEFAAQLGLAAGGSGFDDRDFRNPPKPKQPKAKGCYAYTRASRSRTVLSVSGRQGHKLSSPRGTTISNLPGFECVVRNKFYHCLLLSSGSDDTVHVDAQVEAEDPKGDKQSAKQETTGKGKGHVKGNKFKPEVPGLKDRVWKESVGPRPEKSAAPAPRPAGQSFSRVGLNQVIDKLLDGTPWHEQLADMSELKEPSGKKGKKGKSEGVSEEKQAELVKAARATAESVLERLAKSYEQVRAPQR
eukprot:1194087-Prorocentrum_minimum.AAC.4